MKQAIHEFGPCTLSSTAPCSESCSDPPSRTDKLLQTYPFLSALQSLDFLLNESLRSIAIKNEKKRHMAHVWLEDEQHRWCVAPLGLEMVALSAQGSVGQAVCPPGRSGSRRILLRRLITGETEEWALFSHPSAGVRVNGVQALLGMTALRDRDALFLPGLQDAGRRLFFSTEKLAQVKPLPEISGVCCPRCKQTIDAGTLAVQCPLCGVWHHQRPVKECWCYAERCGACQKQLTRLDAGYLWTPQEL